MPPLHLSLQFANQCDIRSLDAEENYVWSVTGYNEAGVGGMLLGREGD